MFLPGRLHNAYSGAVYSVIKSTTERTHSNFSPNKMTWVLTKHFNFPSTPNIRKLHQLKELDRVSERRGKTLKRFGLIPTNNTRLSQG